MPTAIPTVVPASRPVALQDGPIVVRRLLPADSIGGLTALLHRAYRPQVEMGLAPLAGRQDDRTTRRRCDSGECYVAAAPGGTLVGTILFHEVEDAKGPPWFRRTDVDYFSQFAVEPRAQGRGIGRLLLETAERRALECGAVELGLSMAEPDTALLAFYLARGYRFIEHWRWPYTNYRSAILSKALAPRAGPAPAE